MSEDRQGGKNERGEEEEKECNLELHIVLAQFRVEIEFCR